jgi:hypothetical protein
MKVFWSWQSDTPGKIGRHFVRDALSAAIEQLKQTPEIEEPTAREARSAMHLDQDRKGIPGSPDLARVILEKIEQSTVFVADVTSVGITTTQPEATQPKKVINPNVAIELGYALHALGDRAFLMVMNEHYGSRADLPFDLQSKAGPIIFRLPPDADRKTITAASRQLTAQLAEALELCIAQHVERARQQTPFPEVVAAAEYNPALYFRPDEVLATESSGQEYRFPYARAAYIRLFPSYGNPRIGLAVLNPIFQTRKPVPMCIVQGGVPGRNRFGPIIYAAQGPDKIEGLTQGFETGELWGIDGTIFRPDEHWDYRARDLGIPMRVIPTIDFEKLYVRVLRNYVQVASSALKLDPPYTVELGAVGLKDVYFTAPGLHGRGERKGPVKVVSFQRRYALSDMTDDATKSVLSRYFADLYDLAAFSRKDVFTSDIISAHDLPSL